MTSTTSTSATPTTSTATGIHHPATRPFLLLDATVTAVNGLAYVAAAGLLADWFGAPVGLQRGLGAFLVLVGLSVTVLATRRPVPRRGVLALVVLNEAWVVASVAYAVMGDLTGLGRAWIVLQALVVAAFAAGQLWLARRG